MKCNHPIQLGGAKVPCGQCRACRINYATNWAIRCTMESLGYKENVFLTLTYDDEHLPADRSVSKKVFQNFMKRLRKQIYPAKCRFFGCGEYGSRSMRCHYHLLIFGIGINNPVFENLSWDFKHNGFWCTCKAWQDEDGKSLGHCFIGTVTVRSAQYVAQYVIKKWKGKGAKEHYERLGISPEFSLSSRRPGIGFDYLQSHKNEILTKGYIMCEGSKQPLPRYFQQKLKENTPFYELIMSGESLENALKDGREFLKLEELIDKPQQYIQEQRQQRERNLKKKQEMRGAL